MQKSALFFPLILLVFLGVSLSSCKSSFSTKQLELHQNELARAANSTDLSATQKFDALANTIVDVLDESIRIGGVKKSIKHVDQFAKQNQATMDQIFAELSSYERGMGDAQRLMFFAQMATKPYTRKLITLIPKFERKVNRKVKAFQFVSKLARAARIENLLKLTGA